MTDKKMTVFKYKNKQMFELQKAKISKSFIKAMWNTM